MFFEPSQVLVDEHMPFSQYLADPCERPSLSSSMAKVLMDRSPLHAHHAHPRYGAAEHVSTKAQTRGSLLHDLILGGGPELSVVEHGDWRTKAAREQRDEAIDDGRLPVLSKEYTEAMDAAQAIRARLPLHGVTLSGRSEVTVRWCLDAPTGPVWMRARFDHVIVDGRVIVYDIKTTRDAHPDAVQRHVAKYGYELQAAAYRMAAQAVWPDAEGRISFRFVFVEPKAPHGVLVATLDGGMRERGERRWAAAIDRWAHCTNTNQWPGYQIDPAVVDMPAWVAAQERLADYG